MAPDLRKTGISVVGDLPWGAHFCYFYETKQDLLDILIPYFKTGLENQEFCLWVISNSELLTVEEATSALRNVLPDLDRYVADRSIEVVGHDDWFLSGNIFDPHTVADRFRKKLNEALARGYAGMRVNGSPAWLRNSGQKELRKFEAELDKLFPHERTIASCTYPLASIGGEEIFDVVRTHQFAIARRQGEWEIVETPELIQAKAEIKKLNEELEQRVVERTNELRLANEELRKEIAERKHAEALLHAREQEFRAIVENAPDQIIRYDREFRRTYVNPAVAQFYGLPAESLIGKPLGSGILAAERSIKDGEVTQVRQRIADVFNTGKTYDYELAWTMPDGIKYLSIRLFPEIDLNGSVVNVLGISRDVTERKQAEEALAERLRFETLVTELSAAFANLSPNEVDREIDKWLQTLVEFLGVDRASFFQFAEDWTTLYRSHSYTVPGIEPLPPPMGMKDQFPWITEQLRRGVTVKWARIPDDMPDEATKEKEYAARLGVKSGLNIPVRMGGSVICAITFTSIATYRDWPDAMVARLRPVGEIFAAAIERKRAEVVLRESEERFRQMAENIREVFWMCTADLSKTLYISPAYEVVWGRSCESLYQDLRSVFAAIHPHDRTRAVTIIEAGREQGFEVEYRVVRPDGSIRWIWDRGFPIRDESGRSFRLVGIAEDITERKLAEDALRRSEDRLRLVIDTIPTMAWSLQPDGAIDFVNQRWMDYTGFSLEEAIAEPTGTMHPEDLSGAMAEWGAKMAAEEPFEGEIRLRRADGEYRWFLVRTDPLRDEHGNLIKWYGSSTDIEERKRAEEKLKHSKVQLAQAQRLAHIGSWDWDLRTNAVTWSDELYHIFGLQPGTISVAGEVDRFIHPDDLDLGWDTVKRAVASKEPYDYYHRIIRPDGTERIARSRGSIMCDERGEPSKVFGATQDVTELKRAEEKLKATTEQLRALSASVQSAREEESKRIAREIHDELGGALTSWRWELEEIRDEMSVPLNASQLAMVRNKIEGMITLTETTLGTIRRLASELRPAALELGLVQGLEWQVLQFEHRTGIPVQLDCVVEEVDLDNGQATAVFRILQEALTNILRHAEATRVTIAMRQEAGEFRLTIQDNGKGITESEKSGVRSLGLLGMRERALLLGAKIDITAEEGTGTLVSLSIPIHNG